jgi:DNA-binding NarL/FixJ family response regulator
VKKIKIFLADDHAILRDGLKSIISDDDRFEVEGESGDGREALEMIDKRVPDIAIIDISMPTMSGIELARQTKKYHPEVKILILSQHDNEEYVNELMSIGVDGYMLKTNAGEELIKALTDIQNGNNYLSPRLTTKLLSGLRNPGTTKMTDLKSSFRLLSNREREILKLIAEGKTNKEISSLLFISVETVKTHRASIMKKLDIKNIAEAVQYAIKKGLIEL